MSERDPILVFIFATPKSSFYPFGGNYPQVWKHRKNLFHYKISNNSTTINSYEYFIGSVCGVVNSTISKKCSQRLTDDRFMNFNALLHICKHQRQSQFFLEIINYFRYRFTYPSSWVMTAICNICTCRYIAAYIWWMKLWVLLLIAIEKQQKHC